jgi:signal transduction histidine kinase
LVSQGIGPDAQQNEHRSRWPVPRARDQPPLAEELSALLYQAVRELLFNVAKHAGVRAAAVAMERREADVRIMVSDEGNGFDPAAVQTAETRSSKFGLAGLGERLALLGGQLETKSAPGRGSRFTLRIPLVRPRASRKRGQAGGQREGDHGSDGAGP